MRSPSIVQENLKEFSWTSGDFREKNPVIQQVYTQLATSSYAYSNLFL